MGRLAVLRLVERINAPNAPRTIALLDPSLALRSTQPLRLLFVRAEPNQYLTGDSVLRAAAPVLRAAPEGKGVCPHSLQRLRSTPGG